MNKNKWMKGLSYVVTVLLTASVMTMLFEKRLDQEGRKDPVASSKLDQLYQIIEMKFADEADMEKVTDAGAEAMVDAIENRWSYYIPADQYAAHVQAANNEYVGVGITIREEEETGRLEIIDVVSGGPAQQAGVKVKDFLLEVEGKNCTELGRDGTANLVRGQAGTEVSIVVDRNGERKEFSVKRSKVDVPVVASQVLNSGYGLITIKNFQAKSFRETSEAVESLKKQKVKGIVFDVRFNPGGAKSELVSVLDYLLPEGEIFRSEAYDGTVTTDQSSAGCVDLPMAVLVNGDSYSAAEYFAAAMQEYKWATIVGEKTTGKGYYQQTLRLIDGSAVNLSTGKYYTPSGLNLEGVGITPDVVIELDEATREKLLYGILSPEEDPQIQAAISALDSQELP